MDEKIGEKPAELRLQTFLAHCGVASRRACERLILAGRVEVNGETCTVLGTKVGDCDEVLLDGKKVVPEKRLLHIALYKPKGYVCTLSDEMGRPSAADLLRGAFRERLYNVGRLDMYSEGLVLFTNDGDFAAKVGHPSSQIEKEYLVESVYPFPSDVCREFCRGVRVDGVFYRSVNAEVVGKNRAKITLVEGKNREIRNVLNHFGVKIKRLLRFRLGHLSLADLDLSAGDFYILTDEDVRRFTNGGKFQK